MTPAESTKQAEWAQRATGASSNRVHVQEPAICMAHKRTDSSAANEGSELRHSWCRTCFGSRVCLVHALVATGVCLGTSWRPLNRNEFRTCVERKQISKNARRRTTAH